MTVQELIERLEECEPDADVYIRLIFDEMVEVGDINEIIEHNAVIIS